MKLLLGASFLALILSFTPSLKANEQTAIDDAFENPVPQTETSALDDELSDLTLSLDSAVDTAMGFQSYHPPHYDLGFTDNHSLDDSSDGDENAAATGAVTTTDSASQTSSEVTDQATTEKQPEDQESPEEASQARAPASASATSATVTPGAVSPTTVTPAAGQAPVSTQDAKLSQGVVKTIHRLNRIYRLNSCETLEQIATADDMVSACTEALHHPQAPSTIKNISCVFDSKAFTVSANDPADDSLVRPAFQISPIGEILQIKRGDLSVVSEECRALEKGRKPSAENPASEELCLSYYPDKYFSKFQGHADCPAPKIHAKDNESENSAGKPLAMQ